MPHRSFDVLMKNGKGNGNGRKTHLEIGDARLYRIADVRRLLDDQSRKPFADFLALLLGAHPTEQNILDFANRNPDKWAQAVNTFSKLTGYREEFEVTHNIYSLVMHMSDMDLEHKLREIQSNIGDSYLIDPAEITSPYTRVNGSQKAIRRISRTAKHSARST